MLEPGGAGAARGGRNALDRPVEGDVGLVPLEDADQMIAEVDAA